MIVSMIKLGGEWALAHFHLLMFYAATLFFIFCLGIMLLINRPRRRFKVRKPIKKFNSNDPDVIIIGSGVGGSAMATVLARDGRKVTVIERDMKEPDRVVGELLQPGGVNALKKLGLGDCTSELDAHQIKGYVIHNMASKTEVILRYPENEDSAAILGTAFHHGRFISALREEAKKEPNVTYIEATAMKLLQENDIVIGVEYKCKDEDTKKELYAPLTFVVDGCFSKFRKELVNEVATVSSHFVALLLNNCPQKVDNHAEIILTDSSPILVYQISSNSTRVLVDIRGTMPKDLKDYLIDVVGPKLPDYIVDSFYDSVINGKVRSMPNSYLPPNPVERPGVLVLGDAYNMRHPVTGGGMSVALNDIILWRDILQQIPDLTNYEGIIDALRSFHHRRRNSHSFVVNILAEAFYELSVAQNEHLLCLKNACFEYFQLGGECLSGPASLFSVLNPKPSILIKHFFGVSFYAVYCIYRSEPLWAIHRVLYRSSMVLYSACEIIIPLIWNETRSVIFN